MSETVEQTTEKDNGVLTELRDMVRALFSVQIQERKMPYYGDDKSLYAADVAGYPAFPIAEFDGSITLDRLRAVTEEIETHDMVDDQVKRQAFKKVLGTYHALMYEDATLEEKLTGLIKTVENPDAIKQESIEALSDDAVIYEFAFSGEPAQTSSEQADVIYRNILRTGKWAVSPVDSKQPLVITKEMMDDLVLGFKDGAFEYVTVPETHEDLPSQNRGFVRQLEIAPDPNRSGEYVLRAGIEFTNQEAKKAAIEGSIAGVSCGILFNHQRKSDKKLYNTALHHVALTNKPWIDGLGGWEKIAASEFGADVVVGVEEIPDNDKPTEEKTTMSDNTVTLSQQEIDDLIRERDELKLSQSRSKVADLLRPYQTEKNLTPAVLAQAEKILLAAELSPKMVTLSESNTRVEVDLAETVKSLLDAIPAGMNLTEPTTTEGESVQANQEKPPTQPETLTSKEKAAKLREELGLSELTEKDLEVL